MLVAEVDQYIGKHQLIQKGTKMLVGVSGGPDSMALLQYLLDKRYTYQLDLVAVIIEHGLRGEESEQDVTYVQLFCERNKLKFEVQHVNVEKYKKEHKMGTQEAARILRYQAFDQLMIKHQADYLALAHHADDQVETVYMRLTRGTQLDALQGIKNVRPFSRGKIIRPFLSITKDTIEAYCHEHGIVPRRDLSNDVDVYTRNYFRLNVLPLLKKKNPNLSETIMHMTENIVDDVQYLSDQTKKVSREVLIFSDNPKMVTCQINKLKKHPLALQKRLFHLILDYLYDHLPDRLNYRHEQQFLNLVNSSRANASFDLPIQLKMIKSYQTLTFRFEQERETKYLLPLAIPGRVFLPNEDVLVAEIVEQIASSVTDKWTYYLPVDIDQLPSLVIRTRQPGDRIYLAHVNGRKKVKAVFIDKKIPLDQRDEWPLLVKDNDEVLWVVGLVKGDLAKAVKEDHYIKLTYQSRHKF
ncbi:tRNA lysidine(34) synthetase TilS [Amphibacillus sp. MSJ-3]|uniref:tRNA lysidine(34) synthetase TilS n=1 Tax=Amphibacillus sp. MSJ-3 TaxID=2841505 RepID=UPI001C0F2DE6|nr:tRNA lysidine(34) synthetase TilS [Amphibacillus sp. MSJ-3]MBU5595513.1 tRNA lysidine(34) synthetase TilS [Amphibacillus sp. MSJ-3]